MEKHRLRVIASALVLVFLTVAAAAFEESEVDAVVIPGSSGNRIALTVSNPSSTLAAENLALHIESRPKWLELTEVRSDSDGPLAPGQARRFELVFDVQDDAEVDSVRELKLGFTADRAFFDNSVLVVKLGVNQQTMRLLSIDFGREPDSEIEWQTGHPGFVERYEVAPGEFDVETFCFEQLPLQITPGEPLRFVMKSEIREAYPAGHYCQNRDTAEGSHPKSWLSLNQREVSVEARADLLSYCDEGLVEELGENVKEATDLQSSFEVVAELEPSSTEPGVYRAKVHTSENVTEDGLSGVEIELGMNGLTLVGPEYLRVRYGIPDAEHPAITIVPSCPEAPELAEPPRGGGPLRYRYGYWVITYAGSGYLVYSSPIGPTVVQRGGGQGARVSRLLREPGAGQKAADETYEDLTTYACGGGGEQIGDLPDYWTSLNVTPDGPHDTREQARNLARDNGFEWSPTKLNPEELSAAFGCGEGSRGPNDPRIADALTGGGSAPGTGSEEDTTRVPPIPPAESVHTAFDPSDPATMDPDRHPEVAALIREWIASAKPPGNAVPGVESWYDEYGRTMGGGGSTGRVIGSHDSVSYGSGVSPEARVWSDLRTKLDSVDHCLLEEYVVTKAQGGPIDHCRRRYGAVRDLGGVPLPEAKAEVQGEGFQVQLAPGPTAPSPDLDGAVEGQDPPATRYLHRGQSLTLTVYSPYVPEATVPDLTGLSRSQAKERLEDEGLIVVLRPGPPARSPEESDTIESQQPETGTVLEPGAEVVIWVRPAFVEAITIPDLVGLSTREAREALAAIGVGGTQIDLAPGSAAPAPALSGTVEAQEPAAGWTAEPGTRVRLDVHSRFVDLRTVPSVIGLSSVEAKQRLAALGFEVRLAPGSPAGSPSAEGTVQTQSPDKGTFVHADSVVTLAIHSPWVAPPPEATPTATVGIDSGTAVGDLPLPDLRCPDVVTLSFNRDLCVGTNPNRPPVGARLPLDRQRSGHNNSPSAMEWGRYVFRCYYSIGNYYKEFISVWWSHNGSEKSEFLGPCSDRREGERFGGSYGFFSPTHYVEAKLNGNCFNAREYEAVARNLIRQTEPFARSCSGTSAQTGVTTNPANANTPTPVPAGPPRCPGSSAPRVYSLWDPPPYAGESTICRDSGGNLWINVSNRVRPITAIQKGTKDPNRECWPGTKVVTPGNTYEGNLCQ